MLQPSNESMGHPMFQHSKLIQPMLLPNHPVIDRHGNFRPLQLDGRQHGLAQHASVVDGNERVVPLERLSKKLGVQTRDALEEFDQLSNAFSAFDDCVRTYSLFKYQHVSSKGTDHYIVACQSIASPFDAKAQNAVSMREKNTKMAKLAADLMLIGQEHRLDLKIGMHCGSCVGAVVGNLRSFYCVYGNTINIAARISNEAPLNTILTSYEFAAHLAHLGPACSAFRAIHLKGIGAVDTYRLRGIAEGDLETHDNNGILLTTVSQTQSKIGLEVSPVHQQLHADSKSARDQASHRVSTPGAQGREEVTPGVEVFTPDITPNSSARAAQERALSLQELREENAWLSHWRSFKNIAEQTVLKRTPADQPSIDDQGEQQLRAATYAMLDSSDLSSESRALMAGTRVSWLSSFEDADLEAKFQAESAGVLRLKIFLSLALHLMGIFTQLHFVRRTDWMGGPAALEHWASGDGHEQKMRFEALHGRVCDYLKIAGVLQLILALGLSCLLLGTFPSARGLYGVGGWLVPYISCCSLALAAQRLLFVVTSVRASLILWPLKHWLLVFPAVFSISSFILQSLSLRHFAFFFPATCAAGIYAMHQGLMLDFLCALRTASSFVMLWYVSACIHKDNRGIFQLQEIFFIEMRHLRAMLQAQIANSEKSHS